MIRSVDFLGRTVVRAGLFGLAIAAMATLGSDRASADSIVGLTTDNRLINFDSNSPTAPFTTIAVTGVAANDTLVGIDFRPSNGLLYGIALGVGDAGRVYTINPDSGVATAGATLSATLSGINFGIDFNPQVDRLRIVSSNGQNLRANVDSGATNVDTALNPSSPSISGVAYDNPDNDPATLTELYGIDSGTNNLVEFTSPNGGTVANVGPLNAVFADGSTLVGEFVGFDITGTRTAFAAITPDAGGNSELFSINLDTGFAGNSLGVINGGVTIRGIAIRIRPVPEPGSLALVGLGGLGLILGSRRRVRRAASTA